MTAASDGMVGGRAVAPIQLEFDDNLLASALYGPRDQHLDQVERRLGVSLVPRGNLLAISGPPSATETAQLALSRLYDRLKRGQEIDLPVVEAAIRLAEAEIADKSLSSVAGGGGVPYPQAAHRRAYAGPDRLCQGAARERAGVCARARRHRKDLPGGRGRRRSA